MTTLESQPAFAGKAPSRASHIIQAARGEHSADHDIFSHGNWSLGIIVIGRHNIVISRNAFDKS